MQLVFILNDKTEDWAGPRWEEFKGSQLFSCHKGWERSFLFSFQLKIKSKLKLIFQLKHQNYIFLIRLVQIIELPKSSPYPPYSM